MQSAKRLFLATSLGLTESLVNAKPAPAQMPQQWQLNLQHPATPVMERLYDFHTFLLWIISAIALFVFGLLFLAMVRFREKINPVPSRTTHHTLLEVVWTVAPVLILVMIARALNHLTVPMGIDSPGLMKNPAARARYGGSLHP
jgi:cytochrome c oxidase subunit 2